MSDPENQTVPEQIRFSIHTIIGEYESYECPPTEEEYKRRIAYLQKREGLTVIADIDTTSDKRLDAMRLTILSRRRRATA